MASQKRRKMPFQEGDIEEDDDSSDRQENRYGNEKSVLRASQRANMGK